MKVEIDKNSGFCFGVVNAIERAEELLKVTDKLYCLGDIVHNNSEITRLKKMGLHTITYEQFFNLRDCTVLLRAHGEPPSTYLYAEKNNIKIIDATCPVVLQLQKHILKKYNKCSADTQFVIYGKKGDAEVNGLVGQTNGEAFVINDYKELDKVDFGNPIEVFSQTTKGVENFTALAEEIKKRAGGLPVNIHNTICRQVANRIPAIKEFAKKHELVFFFSGIQSSNGRMLFEICKKANSNSKFLSSPEEIKPSWLKGINSVGICGATSTPMYIMEQAARKIVNTHPAE